MPFPGTKIFAGRFTSATPTPFDTADLKDQLENIGLSCGQLTDANLKGYIADVSAQLPDGATQSFAILAPSHSPTVQASTKLMAQLAARPKAAELSATSLAANVPQYADVATGNWTINPGAEGYASQLEVIQYPTHFDWLYANRETNGFTGVKDEPPAYTGNYPNADAIKQLFVNVSLTASATVVKGLDKSTMQATLSNVISPLKDSQLSNYNVSDSRTIFLVDNYNSSTGYADGVGVVFVSWTLKITDYKRKSKDGGDTHPTNLLIKAGSVLYSDPSPLCANYHAVLKQFGIDPNTAPPCPIATS